MLASDYQRAALTTSGGPALVTPALRLAVAALGLTGESGEVADLLKKHLGHGHDLDLVAVQKEIGDVCWYIAELCNCLGLNLDVVLANNLVKLQRRYPQGFTSSASINRQESEQ
jgi:NTP pyrophosphatase (non-canonical NTP hydrolase)